MQQLSEKSHYFGIFWGGVGEFFTNEISDIYQDFVSEEKLLKSGNFNFKLSQRFLELFPDFFELRLASGPYL